MSPWFGFWTLGSTARLVMHECAIVRNSAVAQGHSSAHTANTDKICTQILLHRRQVAPSPNRWQRRERRACHDVNKGPRRPRLLCEKGGYSTLTHTYIYTYIRRFFASLLLCFFASKVGAHLTYIRAFSAVLIKLILMITSTMSCIVLLVLVSLLCLLLVLVLSSGGIN